MAGVRPHSRGPAPILWTWPPRRGTHREDGSSISLGTDGEWAALGWVDPLGESHHSLGEGGGSDLVYNYFGSWSAAPSDFQVPLADAVAAMEQFAQTGTPVTERVIFQPD